MGLEDRRINLESVAVLQPVADWTQHMQGTKYPTLPLVLSTVYGLIENMGPEVPLTLDFQGQTAYELESNEMHDGVLEARTDMYHDWVSRWITNLDPEVKRTYAIVTLLHPCFNTYNFIDNFDLIPQTDKVWALRELRTEWSTVWKPRKETPAATAGDAATTPIPVHPVPAAEAGTSPPKKQRKVSLGSLLSGRIKKEVTQTPEKTELDELEQYLAELEETDLEINVLVWWQAKESKWPALAKIVKQCFAALASSAGVERVFSAAGKMHGDRRSPKVGQGLDAGAFTLCGVQH